MQPAGPVIPFQYFNFNIIISGGVIIFLIHFRKRSFLNSGPDTTADRHNFFSCLTVHFDALCYTNPTFVASVQCHALSDLHQLMSPQTINSAAAVAASCVNEYSLDGREKRDPGIQYSYTYFELS